VYVLDEELVFQVQVEDLQDLVDVLVETLELLEVRLGNDVGYWNLDHSMKARDLIKKEWSGHFETEIITRMLCPGMRENYTLG
jgi:hypothetical protein